MEHYLQETRKLLNDFRPISLTEMDDVKLMNRVDSKFILSFNQLLPVLENLSDYYRVLTIKNHKIFSYRTNYFDTPDMQMFIDHQNGKLNRYKIRQREYIESNIQFLEIKFKSNKGRVIKDRIEKTADDQESFSNFIHTYTPYKADNLSVMIVNRFNRLTLVDNNLGERITVDINLRFSDHQQELDLNGLVIIEVKQNKNSRQSRIFSILKENGHRPGSFSKYCLGVTMLKRHHKVNNFKRTVNIVNKLSHVELSA
jgi:hypothetical protein